MINRRKIAQNNFKKLKNFKFWEGMKNVRNLHILGTLAIFKYFKEVIFFLGFLKELEVHTVFIDDYKVEYSPK